MLIEDLIETEIYAWTTKRWSSKPGLINTIGTMETPIAGLSFENAYRIWNAKAIVEGVELFMDVGKIYISYVSNQFMIHNHTMIMRFGVWIKVPDDKKKYLKNLEIKRSLRESSGIPELKRKHKDHISSNPLDKRRRINTNIHKWIKNKNEPIHSIHKDNDSDDEIDSFERVDQPQERAHHVTLGGSTPDKVTRQYEEEPINHRKADDSAQESNIKNLGPGSTSGFTNEVGPHKKYTGEHNLLISRTLLELLELTETDSYVQLGDLYFERISPTNSRQQNTGSYIRSPSSSSYNNYSKQHNYD